jgi:hypothetical protein
MGKIIALHAALRFGMSDHGLDGGAPAELALDLVCDASLLGLRVTLNWYPAGALCPL